MNEATKDFIQAHESDDVRQVALQGCKDPAVDFPLALRQIEGRQKAKDKLPEFFARPDILYPASISLEQCSSSETAHYKAALLQGRDFADLTGGFGIDTFAFAPNFEHCHYVEPQAELCELVRHNAPVLGIDNIHIHQCTMEDALPELPTVDCLYLDPSRRDSRGNRVVILEECTPDLTRWKDELLGKTRRSLLAKLSPMLDIKRTLQQLPETTAIHVVAVNNECKEVLFLLEPNANSHEVIVSAANIKNGGTDVFRFSTLEEQNAVPTLADELGEYLYEPNAAIMKAGGFKTVATRFDIRKLHPHTHLYTCSQPIDHFPGRTFRIEQTIPFSKKAAKQLLVKQANIAARNFPLSAEELKKSLKIKDGGDTYIFGATLTGDKKVLLICSKIY